jgi:hypothetical protein
MRARAGWGWGDSARGHGQAPGPTSKYYGGLKYILSQKLSVFRYYLFEPPTLFMMNNVKGQRHTTSFTRAAPNYHKNGLLISINFKSRIHALKSSCAINFCIKSSCSNYLGTEIFRITTLIRITSIKAAETRDFIGLLA